MEQMQEVEIYEETPHPEDWLRVEKLIDDEWVTTGWAPNLKAFISHADAVGGSVRARKETGEEVFTNTENAPQPVYIEAVLLDSCDELCDTAYQEHS